MGNVTNILNKLAGGNKFRIKIIKRRPWDSKKYPMNFSIELVNAELDPDDLSIELNFIISNIKLEFDWLDVRDFEDVFYDWDVQEDFKEIIFKLYKMKFIGVDSILDIKNINYKFIR